MTMPDKPEYEVYIKMFSKTQSLSLKLSMVTLLNNYYNNSNVIQTV